MTSADTDMPTDEFITYKRGLAVGFALLLFAFHVRGQEPLCGLHSVYTAAQLLELEPSFADLLKPEFVGSEQGSTLAELEKAAAMLGMQSLSVGKLTTTDLLWCRWPVVLHVKTDVASSNYNHFVLFGGMRDGTARIYDGPNGVYDWTLAEVASRWDGNAMILSTGPIDLWRLAAPSRTSIAFWGVAIAAAAALALAVQKRLPASGAVCLQPCATTCSCWAPSRESAH